MANSSHDLQGKSNHWRWLRFLRQNTMKWDIGSMNSKNGTIILLTKSQKHEINRCCLTKKKNSHHLDVSFLDLSWMSFNSRHAICFTRIRNINFWIQVFCIWFWISYVILNGCPNIHWNWDIVDTIFFRLK